MGTKITQKAVKVIGTQKYINAQTGTVEEMNVITVEERDFNFHKLWLRNILTAVDLIGNQKIKLAFWIIEHLNSENQLNYTYEQMQKETNISMDTIKRTMKALMDCDFLRKKHSGCYIINPNMLYKGCHKCRMNVLIKYQDTKIQSKDTEIITSEKIVALSVSE